MGSAKYKLSMNRIKRQQIILNAALEVFLRQGFEQTTVVDLVRASRMSRGTFYLYYNSIEAVLDFLIASFCTSLQKLSQDLSESLSRTAEFVHSQNAKETIENLIHTLISQQSRFMLFAMTQLMRSDRFRYERINQAWQDFLYAMEKHLEDEGIADDNAKPLASILMAIVRDGLLFCDGAKAIDTTKHNVNLWFVATRVQLSKAVVSNTTRSVELNRRVSLSS